MEKTQYLQQTHKCQTVVAFPHLQESHKLLKPRRFALQGILTRINLYYYSIETMDHLLKLFGSIWIILIRVRVIFLGKLIVCLLYILLTRTPNNGAH